MKFFNFLRMLRSNRGGGPYLQKDDDGKDIYYPWGYTGDKYYVNKNDNRALKLSLYVAGLSSFGFVVFLNSIEPRGVFGAMSLSLTLTIVLWLFFLAFYQKRMRVADQKAKNVLSRKPRVVCDLALFAATQSVLLTAAAIDSDPLFWGGVSSAIIFYPLAIWFFWARRGYIFQEEKP